MKIVVSIEISCTFGISNNHKLKIISMNTFTKFIKSAINTVTFNNSKISSDVIFGVGVTVLTLAYTCYCLIQCYN